MGFICYKTELALSHLMICDNFVYGYGLTFFLRNNEIMFAFYFVNIFLFYWVSASDMSHSTEVIKLFSCSTQLSMIFQLLIKTKMLKIKDLIFYHFGKSIFCSF